MPPDAGALSETPLPALIPPVRGGVFRSAWRWWRQACYAALFNLHGLGAFTLITLGVLFSKGRMARQVIRPQITWALYRWAFRLLPLITFLSLALGLVVIGQSVTLLTKVGAQDWLGLVMTGVVVRELGPLLAAMVMLARSGTANVIELGTARALGEVESLEAVGIDPVHYLVVPRVIALGAGLFALTIYLIVGAVLSGYAWAFIQDIPISLGDYFQQLAKTLTLLDFIVLAAKSVAFGGIIAVVTSYHGLAQPVRLRGLSDAAIRAVAHSVLFCALAELFFIGLYLVS